MADTVKALTVAYKDLLVHVYEDPQCTLCIPQKWFSYSRHRTCASVVPEGYMFFLDQIIKQQMRWFGRVKGLSQASVLQRASNTTEIWSSVAPAFLWNNIGVYTVMDGIHGTLTRCHLTLKANIAIEKNWRKNKE